MNNFNFEEIKKTVLPYFIAVYGNKYKNIIIEKMQQIYPVFYCSDNSVENYVSACKKSKRVELTIKFLEKNGICLSKKLQNELMKQNSCSTLKGKTVLLDACFEFAEYEYNSFILNIKRVPIYGSKLISKYVKFFNSLYYDVTEKDYNNWIKSPDSDYAFERLYSIKKALSQLDSEYNEYNKKFKQEYEFIEKYKELKNIMNEKYYNDYLKYIEQLSLTSSFVLPKSKDELKKLVGTFDTEGVIDFYSSKSNEILKKLNTSHLEIHNIETKRKQCPFIINSKTADKVIKKRNSLKNHSTHELIESINNLNDIERINGIKKNKLLNNISDNFVGIHPLLINNYIINLLYFNQDSSNYGVSDISLIYYMIYAIETALIEKKPNQYESLYKSGFSYHSFGYNDNKKIFSSIINQKIATEITSLMHIKGDFLLDTPSSTRINNNALYENNICVVQEFYNTFKKNIIDYMINNDSSIFFSVIGEDNFNRLNEVVNKHNSLIGLKDESNQLILEAHRIVLDMVDHSKKVKSTNNILK